MCYDRSSTCGAHNSRQESMSKTQMIAARKPARVSGRLGGMFSAIINVLHNILIDKNASITTSANKGQVWGRRAASGTKLTQTIEILCSYKSN